MKAIVLHDFTDKKVNKRRIKGEIFEIAEKRFKEINNSGFGELIEKIEEKEIENESD